MSRPVMKMITAGVYQDGAPHGVMTFDKAVAAWVFSLNDHGSLELTSFGSRMSTEELVVVYRGLQRVVNEMGGNPIIIDAINRGIDAEITQTGGGEMFVPVNRKDKS